MGGISTTDSTPENTDTGGSVQRASGGQIARDLELAGEIGCKYHVCHISTKESVELIRQAKARGVDVTCETGPHYLVFSDMDLQEDGRFKMNPPIRSAEDREACAGVCWTVPST